MPERKKRTRTGCLTCRSRRIKCDERKPTCGRCTAANVACAGYEEPRVIVSNKRRKSSVPSPSISIAAGSPIAGITASNDLSNVKPDHPLIAFPNNPADYQVPHARAREVLGHQQFTARTVNLLFRHDHLYFWRDQLMQTAWDTEYVFDAIIAVGNMHRSVLLLSKHNDQFRGNDVRFMALEYYGRTLRQIAEIYGHDYSQTSETLVAVLLLLTCFECFMGNVTGALRHLCVAQQHLASLDALHALDETSIPHRDPLVACANDLAMTARVTLPLAPITLSLSIDMIVPRMVFGGAETVEEEFQQLIALIRADTTIRTACWRPLGHAEANTSVEELVAFQATLKEWKASAQYIDQETIKSTDGGFKSARQHSSEEVLDLPPPPQTFKSIRAALGVALYNCYMGRTMQMRARAGDSDAEECLRQADQYIYDNLCIVQGLWKENDQRPLEERIYMPYERINIGLTPLLYLGAHICRPPSWVSWSKEKLRSIGREGIYNSLALATALDLEAQLEQLEPYPKRPNPDARAPRTTDLIVVPDTEGRCFIAYLLRRLPGSTNATLPRVQIVGSARWDTTMTSGAGNKELLLHDENHPLNKDILMQDPYVRLASYDSYAHGWKTLLAEPTYSPAAYLPEDFDLPWDA